MTQQAQRRPGPLRALGLVAAASLVAAGAAGTARAADEPLPVTITGEDRVDLSLGSGDDSPEPQIDLRLNVPGEEFEGDGVVPPVFTGDYTIRIDATGLEGVASVDLPCDVDGLVATCTGWELYAGQQYNRVGKIRLDVDDDSEAGDSGSIKVTGEGEGLDFTPLDIDVLVGGPEFLNHTLPLPGDLKAGDTYKAPVGLRNVGTLPAEGAVLRFHGSRGVSFPDSFGNCAYSEVTTGPLLRQGTDVICTFPDTIEAGAAYALAEPLKVGTADFALRDIFTYSFTAVPPDEADGLREGKEYRQGNGVDLELRQVSDADPADYTRYAELDLPLKNTYDLELTGASLDAGAGDTVTAEIGFRNNGPAWISALRSGGEPFSFTVKVPEGATVTKAPEKCRETTLAEDEKGYRCWVSTPLLEDAEFTYPFELRVDRVVENAKGEVALPDSGDPAESDRANNSAWIVLNGPDEQTDGGTGQNGGGATPSASPSPSPSSSSGSGQDGGTGSSGSGTNGTSGGVQGGLASTGAGGTALIGGAALLTLGLGAGVTVLLRRRGRRTGGAIA
ncbi:hypothetical protein [Streptomyces sp. NRRL S-37]|uniref:hypothetical protein n=1 Tax=Streptomyces sp. NRRL S-37 TaxID=1463903 RepID=UPI00055E30C6|nr:hypothetical protein [Streptomyces sp. NRRL S-37]